MKLPICQKGGKKPNLRVPGEGRKNRKRNLDFKKERKKEIGFCEEERNNTSIQKRRETEREEISEKEGKS